jgi:hypothetical protein
MNICCTTVNTALYLHCILTTDLKGVSQRTEYTILIVASIQLYEVDPINVRISTSF